MCEVQAPQKFKLAEIVSGLVVSGAFGYTVRAGLPQNVFSRHGEEFNGRRSYDGISCFFPATNSSWIFSSRSEMTMVLMSFAFQDTVVDAVDAMRFSFAVRSLASLGTARQWVSSPFFEDVRL